MDGWMARSRLSPAPQAGSGCATAEIFVAEGAKIVIAGRRAPEGEALANKLGGNCIFRQTDVTVEDEMRALIGQAVEKFGRIDWSVPTTPAARRKPAALRALRLPASTPRWPPWCAV